MHASVRHGGLHRLREQDGRKKKLSKQLAKKWYADSERSSRKGDGSHYLLFDGNDVSNLSLGKGTKKKIGEKVQNGSR